MPVCQGIVSVCSNTICLSQRSLSEVYMYMCSEKNLIGQLVSQLSLSEIVWFRQLNSQLHNVSLSENVVHRDPWGLHRVLHVYV